MNIETFGERLEHLIKEALNEDVGDGDHSTLSCIPKEKKGKAILKIKQDGILAGIDVAKKIFSFAEPGTIFSPLKSDGGAMYNGEIAFEVEANIHTILKCERLVLNCMQRMSGISTLTRTYVEKLAGYHTRSEERR